jgi:branched-chain amino acid transport system substrate-binding protein
VRHVRQMLTRNTIAIAAVAAFGLVGVSACGGDDAADTTTSAPATDAPDTSGAPDTSAPSPDTTDAPAASVAVGALLDLSGPGRTLGLASKAALEAAVADLAEEGTLFELVVEDTAGDVDTTVAAMEQLLADGVRVFVGPQTSSGAGAVLDLATEAGALLISQGSTAGTLAIAGDALHRMLPTDRFEGAATADLVVSQGITHLVTLHRDDAGNAGLVAAVTDNVGDDVTVIAGSAYPAADADLGAIIAELATLVDDAISGAGDGAQAGVYLAGFEEVADILAAAADVPVLRQVIWYGGDGSALSGATLGNAAAAGFAAAVGGMPSPLPTFGSDAVEAPQSLVDAYSGAGLEPDVLGYAAYDALRLVAIALESAPDAEGAELWAAFAAAADGYAGVSGVTTLDEAGDRLAASFGFWSICADEDADGNLVNPQWALTVEWTPPTGDGRGTINDLGCPTDDEG